MNENKERATKVKIFVIGDSSSGTTELLRRYCSDSIVMYLLTFGDINKGISWLVQKMLISTSGILQVHRNTIDFDH